MPAFTTHLTDSKLVRTLKELTPVEMNQLEKFIHSPFFCTDAKAIELFDYLKGVHPTFSAEALNKRTLSDKFFPEEKDKAKSNHFRKLRLCTTYLLNYVYDYFRQIEWREDAISQQYYLLHYFRERGIVEDQERMLQKSFRMAKEINPPSELDQLNLYLLADYELASAGGRFSPHHIDKALIYLDQFYLTAKLKRFCLALQKMRLTRQNYDLNSLGQTLDFCATYKFRTAIAAIYYYLLKAFIALEKNDMDDAIVQYRSLKRVRQGYLSNFEVDFVMNSQIGGDIETIFNQSLSICNHLYRQGLWNYRRELFGLYKEMLDYGLLHHQGFIWPNHFKNMVTLGLRVRELNWVEQFITVYGRELPPSHREDVYTYNFAHLQLYRKNYRAVNKMLNQTQFIDPFYNVDARVIRLKAYYGLYTINRTNILEIEEDLFRIADNFIRYLRREKVLAFAQKEAYKNFIRYIKILWRIQIGEKSWNYSTQDEIKSCALLVEREWLLEQFDLLK